MFNMEQAQGKHSISAFCLFVVFLFPYEQNAAVNKAWEVSRSQTRGSEQHFCSLSVQKRLSSTIYLPPKSRL